MQEGRLRFAAGCACEIATIACDSFYELLRREITKDPWITAQGPACDPVALEDRPANATQSRMRLPANASMTELISALWRLPRDIVSDGYDVALQALSTQAPMVIHEYPSGTECWTWLVPEKWTCHEAFLETMDGRRLFHMRTALCMWSRIRYRWIASFPDRSSSAISTCIRSFQMPFRLSSTTTNATGVFAEPEVESLADRGPLSRRYSLDLRYGTLKVGEIFARGNSAETFVLCAHLCHPAMVNDDLSGVVVGLKVMQLLKRSDLHYTYRFLILPETIGSIAYLSHNEQLIPQMMGGLFLEMLGLNQPHASAILCR